MRVITFIMLIAAVLVFPGCAVERSAVPVSGTEFLLDTVCTITIYELQDPDLILRAFELCEELEALFSISIEGSDVWRINHAGSEIVRVSPETAEVIREGVLYGGFSEGLFDITIGRLSRLWDFSGIMAVPDEEDLSAAQKTVDYTQIMVDGDMVRLANADAWIDLGGIAKGYIADRLAVFLADNGAASGIVDLGGNIVTFGERPDGRLWRIGVKHPFGAGGDLFGVIEVGKASVVTSGVYERSFEIDGVLYHHILDPFSGFPARSDVVSATVVSDSSMLGDVLSTVLLLAGSERAEGLLERIAGVAGALLILEDGGHMIFGDIEFSQ